MGTRLHTIRQFLSELRSASPQRYAGFVDFSYQHYALGDALTTQVYLACLAHQAGCTSIDIHLVAHADAPAAPTQPFVNRDNYAVTLDNLLPAWTCLPQLESLRVVRDAEAAAAIWTSLVASRAPVWPSARTHLLRQMTYPLGHQLVNAFHAREGSIPRLSAPRGYGAWARSFVQRHWPGRFVVCINPRQSRLSGASTASYRDAPLDEWHAFIRETHGRHPDVLFVMLGGFSEWDSRLARCRNVAIARAMGLTLAHELALLVAADAFMGSSSGFATMATFSEVPYLITNVEHLFAWWAGVAVDAPRYPFALDHQHLTWREESAGVLLEHFEAIYHARPRARAQ